MIRKSTGRPRKPRGNYFFKLRPHWTGLIWVAAAIAATALYLIGTGAPAMIGVVEGDPQLLRAPETGRLTGIEARLGDEVQTGQIIARMDHSLLEAKRTVAQAQLAKALLEADAERRDAANFQRQATDTQRSIQDEILRTEQMLAAATVADTSDRARLAALQKEHERNRKLAESSLIPLSDANATLPEIAALEASVRSRTDLIQGLQRDLVNLQASLGEHTAWVDSSATEAVGKAPLLTPAEAAARLFAAESNLLDIQRAALDLKAERPGILSEILFRLGDMVEAGETVARLVPTKTHFVLGMLPENHARNVKEGQMFLVRSRDSQFGVATRARVVFVAPEIQSQPGRISPISGQSLRVRRIRLELLDPHHLLPDETVQIEPPSFWRGTLARLLHGEEN